MKSKKILIVLAEDHSTYKRWCYANQVNMNYAVYFHTVDQMKNQHDYKVFPISGYHKNDNARAIMAQCKRHKAGNLEILLNPLSIKEYLEECSEKEKS